MMLDKQSTETVVPRAKFQPFSVHCAGVMLRKTVCRVPQAPTPLRQLMLGRVDLAQRPVFVTCNWWPGLPEVQNVRRTDFNLIGARGAASRDAGITPPR